MSSFPKLILENGTKSNRKIST